MSKYFCHNSNWNEKRVETLRSYAAAGHSIHQIACLMNVTCKTVKAKMKAYGIPIPDRVIRDAHQLP